MIENKTNGANLGFEDKLRAAADKLRGNMDGAEYKHVVLGLIFLKYISDAFLEKRADLEVKTADAKNEWYVKEPEACFGVLENRDEYLPKLLSGELELPAIETIGEGAV